MRLQFLNISIALKLACLSPAANAQDIAVLRGIDSIISTINQSEFELKQDTIIQDQPSIGLYMKTYLTAFLVNSEVRRFTNYVVVTRQENGNSQDMTTVNSFYYDRGQLIKVEEAMFNSTQAFTMSWYFANGQPFYHSLQTEKASARANQLLIMAKEMLKKL